MKNHATLPCRLGIQNRKGSVGGRAALQRSHPLPATAADRRAAPAMVQVNDFLKPLMLKDLRTQCRARGLNPGGSREALAERVGEHMLATQDL